MSKKQAKQLTHTRIKFRESCSDALRDAEAKPPLLAAQQVWAIPSDLASHGFQVSMSQGESGWIIEVETELGNGWFSIQGTGTSMLAALKALTVAAEKRFAQWETAIFSEDVTPAA